MEAFVKRGGLWVLAQGVLLAAYAVSLRFSVLSAPANNRILATVGISLAAIGSLWTLWSMLVLRRSLSPFPAPIRANVLVSSGPYRIVRHPIYTGLCLGLAGWAVYRGSAAALVIVATLIPFFLAKARSEERMLIEKHSEYGAYIERTRWRILPCL